MTIEAEAPARSITPAPPYVVIKKAAELTGYSVTAIERKIDRGEWREGEVWFKAPDGRRLISIKGFAAWVEKGRAWK